MCQQDDPRISKSSDPQEDKMKENTQKAHDIVEATKRGTPGADPAKFDGVADPPVCTVCGEPITPLANGDQMFRIEIKNWSHDGQNTTPLQRWEFQGVMYVCGDCTVRLNRRISETYVDWVSARGKT